MISLLVLASLLAGSIAPVSAAEWNGRFSIWRNSAFATQYWDYSCVGATIQIMLNLIHGRSDESRNRQDEYLDFAQAESRYEVTDQGADPEGWAQAMVRYDGGDDYGWAAAPTAQESLWVAARQMRETEKPVGLLVHLGRHAWVMTGFESTADPALTDDFEVTAAEVVGPLWPHGTLNGTSFDPGPRTWMDIRTLSRKFDTYAEPGQEVWQGRYVTIIPKASEANQGTNGPGGPGTSDAPDLNSAFGWAWALRSLAAQGAVRDLIWLR
ncbi:MAG TPA: hypothetical protein VEX62_00350 [Candidatus Limnocylindrales bacterium]|nr:hypothetical protein [Candidatus Limnocylindrales bacterium]